MYENVEIHLKIPNIEVLDWLFTPNLSRQRHLWLGKTYTMADILRDLSCNVTEEVNAVNMQANNGVYSSRWRGLGLLCVAWAAALKKTSLARLNLWSANMRKLTCHHVHLCWPQRMAGRNEQGLEIDREEGWVMEIDEAVDGQVMTVFRVEVAPVMGTPF